MKAIQKASTSLLINTMLLIVILMLSNNHTANAQRPYFKTLAIPATFGKVKVNQIFQDKKGFIWLGTTNGVIKFDGLNYKLFMNEDTLCTNVISAISQCNSSEIWIGYQDGQIARIKNNKLTSLILEEGFPKAAITGFAESDSGTVCIATAGEGLYYYKKKRLYNLNTDDGLSDDYIYTLKKDNQNRIWMGTDRGINIIAPDDNIKEITILSSKNGLPDNIVMELELASDNLMWIGMQDKGICNYDLETQVFSVPERLQNWNYGPVSGIVLFENEIWIGTQNKGIIALVQKYDAYTRTYQKTEGLRNNTIQSLCKDKENNVWIAFGENFIQSVNKKFEFIHEHEGVHFGNMNMVSTDGKGNLWFSNDEGLFSHKIVFTGFNILRKWIDNGMLNQQQIISFYEDYKGLIWIGTFGDGVICLDPENNEIKHFRESDGLVNNNVFAIAGNKNEIWFATLGGVSRLTIDSTISQHEQIYRFENFDKTQGLGNNFIYTVFIDSKDRVWFGTDGQGITVYANGLFKNFNKSLGLKNAVVLSITEDHDGNIWFSTSNTGIYKFNSRTVKNYALKEGLSDLSVSGMITDSEGNILIIHQFGIDILNPRKNTFTYYGQEMGISSIDQELNAVAKDINGDVWIATKNAMIKYTSDKEKIWEGPSTHINEVSVFFQPVSGDELHHLKYNQNHITFDYVGLWYQNPEKVQYSYKLQGHDLDWIITKDKQVTYPKLAPGDYTFSVRSSVDGNHTEAVVESFSFHIRKPFWLTYWFIIVSTLAILGILYFLEKMRIARLKEHEELQKEKAVHQFETLKSQVNPHFLFNSFNTLAAVIEENQELAVEYVEKLSDYYRNILQYREMDTIQLREEIELINDYYFLQKKRYDKNLEMSIDIPEDKLEYKISPLTLQMLIENAIKHNVISKDKPLHIQISMSNGHYLKVTNNVQKKRQRVKSTNIGLQNISNRYKLLTDQNVEINITDSHFSVNIPLIKS